MDTNKRICTNVDFSSVNYPHAHTNTLSGAHAQVISPGGVASSGGSPLVLVGDAKKKLMESMREVRLGMDVVCVYVCVCCYVCVCVRVRACRCMCVCVSVVVCTKCK